MSYGDINIDESDNPSPNYENEHLYEKEQRLEKERLMKLIANEPVNKSNHAYLKRI